jgi:hypothetical protein
MLRHFRALHLFAGALLVGLLALNACAVAPGGSTSVTGGGATPTAGKGATPTVGKGAPPTPTPAPCATHASTTALTYADGPNVAGDIPAPPGAPAAPAPALSNFIYPLGIPDENAVGNAPTMSFTAIAPDAAHLAVAIQQVVPFTAEYDPFIVNTATHAVSKVSLPHPITVANTAEPPRLFAWADTHTLIIFANPAVSNRNAAGDTFSYDITTHVLTPLPGITAGAIEGVVRCSTLFYLSIGSFTTVSASDPNHTMAAPTSINRYNLASHSAIGSPVAIGQASTFPGAEGEVDYGGWDASRDGSRIVYQREAVAAGPQITSTWFVANADGSAASAILPKLTSSNGARMAISPDGKQVAVTNANPSPNVASGPLSGGSTVFYNSPSGDGQPAWLANSGGFFASSVPPYTPNSVILYTLCGGPCVGTPAVAKANNPATLP